MNSYFYKLFLPAHLGLASLYYYDTNIITIVLCWILLSGYGIASGFHRLFSHRSFNTNRVFEIIILYLGTISIQGSSLFWSAVHRGYHHRHADTSKDIHSPIHGKLWAYVSWSLSKQVETIELKYAGSLLKDRVHLFFHRWYFEINWITWFVAYAIEPTLFVSLLIAQLITLHQEHCSNLFGHLNWSLGYRNYETNDNSRNYYLFGLICWGIGYHNNHHYDPHSYDFGKRRYEIDFTKYLIQLIKK